MATNDTLYFGTADPVTHDPKIDGLVDYDFLPYNEPAEVGYTLGSKMTYEGGSLPRVVFQGVRGVDDPNRLSMGFMCRFDTSFDVDDMIVIVLKTAAATVPAGRRMIVITPNLAGVGADAGTGDPAFPAYQIKRDKPPAGLHFYRETGTDYWNEFDPTGIEVKVRSWVIDRGTGIGLESCWSVEVGMPRDGSGGWIKLDDDFGLYFSVIRIINPGSGIVQSTFPTEQDLVDTPGASYPQIGAGPNPITLGHAMIPAPGSSPGVGVHFTNGWQSIGRRKPGTTTLSGSIVGPTGSEDNEIVAQFTNDDGVEAKDISAEFRFANWGLPNTWDTPLNLTPNPTAAPDPNAAGGGGTGEVFANWPHGAVPASYIGHEHQCMTAQLSSPHNVNFSQQAVRRNMDFVNLSTHTRTAEVSGENYPDPPAGKAEQEFLLETFCRPITVAEYFKEKEHPDRDKQKLVYDALHFAWQDRNRKQDFVAPFPTDPGVWKNSVIFVWITTAYRRTGTSMKLNGNVYEILDPHPGAFGLVAHHEGVNDKLSFAFDGPGLVRYAPGSYGLKVPHKGRTTIDVTLTANNDQRGGDVSKVPEAPWPKPGDPTFGSGSGPDTGGGDTLPKGCLAALFGIFGAKS